MVSSVKLIQFTIRPTFFAYAAYVISFVHLQRFVLPSRFVRLHSFVPLFCFVRFSRFVPLRGVRVPWCVDNPHGQSAQQTIKSIEIVYVVRACWFYSAN
jgi:hypothetical protein